jgi:hypothetical protein
MYVPFSAFSILFVCKCVLHYCHLVTTQLQLKINIRKCPLRHFEVMFNRLYVYGICNKLLFIKWEVMHV